MDKFFDIIKKLRVPAQQGKISRQAAIDALMQESGVSEEIAARAADNMLSSKPEVPGGITTLPQAEVIEASFKPGMDKRGKVVEESPSQASGSRNLLTEEEAPGLYSLRRDIESLADEESWKYSMAKWRQDRAKKMEPIYKKYGAVTERDRALLDEYIEMDVDGNITMSSSNPKYDKSVASIFIQESAEEAAGRAGADIASNILYGRVAENILMDEGLDAYIDYAFKELKKEGLTFNRNLLKKVLKEKYGAKDIPEEFAVGGRVGFKDGPGKLGIIQSLLKKVNEIAPGSTAVGKTTKAMSEKAARKKAEQELFAGFNERNPVRPSNTKIIEREKIDVDIGTIEDFYDDFVQAGGDPSVSLKDLEQGYNLKKAYPFNTPYINKKGQLIGQEATQKMYPESKKFYIEDENVLSQKITDIREGRMPKTAEGERTGVEKAGQGRFTKAEVLENIINNTIKEFKNDPEIGDYVTNTLPNILKEIKANPKLANNENVFNNLTKQLVNNPNQRLVVYDDDTVDFFTKGQKTGLGSAKALADEFGISMEEAVKIQMMEPEDQVLEIQRRRALNKRKLNASGGLNYLMGM